jgi:hypothetical protein
MPPKKPKSRMYSFYLRNAGEPEKVIAERKKKIKKAAKKVESAGQLFRNFIDTLS